LKQMKALYFAAALLAAFVFGSSAQADDFGNRFGETAPAALTEEPQPQALLEIEPAAGEETALPVTEETPAEEAPVAPAEVPADAPVVDGVPVTVPLETPAPAAEIAPDAAVTAPIVEGEAAAPVTETAPDAPVQETYE
jgi:hypothetical protein